MALQPLFYKGLEVIECLQRFSDYETMGKPFAVMENDEAANDYFIMAKALVRQQVGIRALTLGRVRNV